MLWIFVYTENLEPTNNLAKRSLRHGLSGENYPTEAKFHVTANQVMQLAKRVWEIFESSKVEEKRQLLNFVFQNLKLDAKKLLVTLRELFHLFIQVKDSPGRWG